MRAFKKKNLSNKIHVVSDGAEALDFLFGKGAYSDRTMTDIPKVVLLDIKLPKVSGIEVLRKVNASGKFFISSTKIRGKFSLRICPIGHRTRESDMRELIAMVGEMTVAVNGSHANA